MDAESKEVKKNIKLDFVVVVIMEKLWVDFNF